MQGHSTIDSLGQFLNSAFAFALLSPERSADSRDVRFINIFSELGSALRFPWITILFISFRYHPGSNGESFVCMMLFGSAPGLLGSAGSSTRVLSPTIDHLQPPVIEPAASRSVRASS